ncbi:twin-arginine translocase TatA/TatE family subunit [Caenispirillum bisanense]|uniref:Sec-independent protein translocase protein TatA n=1 Tax=Caenispirillum bisanense TaxID=414052 RepID=A0A286H198_9PROT|nr:twin-arginine translocase TatA/TatE family subunit [Caenispirillum bisanense]SOE01119.1 sec-independent protein translocase protein TatA [Caenispirillum bisanense]
MGTFSIWHWIIVLLVVLVLFGAGKIPRLMGDVAKGVNAFKKGLKEGDDTDDASATTTERKSIEGGAATTSNTTGAAPVNKERDEAGAKG